jgi:hypothetical protein
LRTFACPVRLPQNETGLEVRMTVERRMSRAEQRERKTLSAAVAGELKRLVRGTGWRIAQGWIFREAAGWFIEVRANVWMGSPVIGVALSAKPMSLDPIFWDIVRTPENRDQPLSFRLFGAWTCSVPALVEAELPECEGNPEKIARNILRWADAQLSETEPSRSFDNFLASLRDHPRRGSYLASYITALILGHRWGEALEESTAAKERGETAGFMAGALTFPEMAQAWLESPYRGEALH